jgi:hypothetical protein
MDRGSFEREMELRIRAVEARGEAAILRVNVELRNLRARIEKLEKEVLGGG